MIVIVGAGLAGLACGKILAEAGKNFLIIEGNEKAGGRVATINHSDGYILDRGFQIALDSYSALHRHVALKDLLPCYFDSGAILSGEGKRSVLCDPVRHPKQILSTTLSSSLSIKDRIDLAKLSLSVQKLDPENIDQWEDLTVQEVFQREKLSERLVGRLLAPFFQGVLLDPDLDSDSSLFRFYFSLFSKGRAFIPRKGMQAIPELMLNNIPKDKVRFGSPVKNFTLNNNSISSIELDNRETIQVERVILASDLRQASSLLNKPLPINGRETTTLYFSSNQALYDDKLLVLPSTSKPLVRHFVHISNINPESAPTGKHLLAASIIGSTEENLSADDLFQQAIEEISHHQKGAKDILEPLHAFRVCDALPPQTTHYRKWHQKHFKETPSNLILSGDHTSQGSIQGAIISGERAAQKVLSAG